MKNWPLIVLMTFGMILTMLLLTLFGVLGRAVADTGASQDPVSLMLQLYSFMRTGKGTAAVGILTMIIVWMLRSGLAAKFDFFKSQTGGYLLGFSIPTLEYVAVALLAPGVSVTFSLFVNAFGAGFVAAGGWEAFRDLITRTPRARPIVAAASVALVFLMSVPACGPNGPGPVIASAVIDCTKVNQEQLGDLVEKHLPTVMTGDANWTVIKQEGKHISLEMAGCLLGELVQAYLGGRMAPEDQGSGWAARTAFEDFRKTELNNATVVIRSGQKL